MSKKPLNRKSYGSIGHLPQSRLGTGDHKVAEGQMRIATLKKRDKHDTIIVQEKLDGSNVGVALKDGIIYPLIRAGYIANSSPYQMHHEFHKWVELNEARFRELLAEGERVCGEWLIQAHGTRYKLPHEPFVAFDIFNVENKRVNYGSFKERINNLFVMPHEISSGDPVTVEAAMEYLGKYGYHGALEEIEGAVWRVERKGIVDFLCKFVRPDKEDGIYLNQEPVMNEWA